MVLVLTVVACGSVLVNKTVALSDSTNAAGRVLTARTVWGVSAYERQLARLSGKAPEPLGPPAVDGVPALTTATQSSCRTTIRSETDVSILGPAQVNEPDLLAWYFAQGYPAAVNGTPASTLLDDYYNIGTSEGVRADWAFVQAILETGGFRSEDTTLDNFAGIGHFDGALSGIPFDSVLTGITAQIQLLKRVVLGNQTELANPPAAGLPNWSGKIAKSWAGLSANWASAPEYGESLAALHSSADGACLTSVSGQDSQSLVDAEGLWAQRVTTVVTAATGPTFVAGDNPVQTAGQEGPGAATSTDSLGVSAVGAPTTSTTAPGSASAGPPSQTTSRPTPTPTPTPTQVASPIASSAASGDMVSVINFAAAQVGKAWSASATGPDTWDLPGLVVAAFQMAGMTVTFSDESPGIADAGTVLVGLDQIQPGDLVFQSSPSGVRTEDPSVGSSDEIPKSKLIGLYTGNGSVICAPDQGTVQVEPLSNWASSTLTVRRVATVETGTTSSSSKTETVGTGAPIGSPESRLTS